MSAGPKPRAAPGRLPLYVGGGVALLGAAAALYLSMPQGTRPAPAPSPGVDVAKEHSKDAVAQAEGALQLDPANSDAKPVRDRHFQAQAEEARRIAETQPVPTPTPTVAPPPVAPPVAPPQPTPPPATLPPITAPPATSPPATAPPGEEPAIRKLVEDYARAIQSRDVALFRTVKPNLSGDEEKRLRNLFKAVKSYQVSVAVVSIQIDGDQAKARVARRDTIEGKPIFFHQSLVLARGPGGWTIRDIGQ